MPVVGPSLEAASNGNVRQPPQVQEEASLQVQLQVLEGAVEELQGLHLTPQVHKVLEHPPPRRCSTRP